MTPEDKISELIDFLRHSPLSPDRFKLLKLLIKIYDYQVPDLSDAITKAVNAAIDDDESADKRTHIEQLMDISGKTSLQVNSGFVLTYELLEPRSGSGKRKN